MAKNKKFLGYGILLSILGIVFMFLYSGLQNDQINIIQAFSGWSGDATMAPMTVGNFVCIVLTFLYGTMFIKFGVKKSLIPTMILCAVGCIGVAAANGLACNGGEGNYVLYFISLFITRCTCMMLQMAGFQLVASWFVRFRGQIMGVITVGSPLFSVVGTAGMTTLITKKLGGDYRPYLTSIRMEEAIKLLRITDLKTYEIGEKVGYNNVRRFVDAFKQIYNVSPMEYRKSLI